MSTSTTTTTTRRLQLTWQELLEEAVRRFGPDDANWAFWCPSCGDIATKQEWRDATGDPETPYPGQECIGRVVAGRGCKRTAYGLICGGTWTVDLPDGVAVVDLFPLAPATVRGADL